MRMKKFLAGVAAAATMLGGFALGAATAVAADATITIHNSQQGHVYTAYRFAELVRGTNTADEKPTIEVSTVDAYKEVVRAAAEEASGADAIPGEYAGNPAAYVATLSASQLRLFAEALTKALPLEGVAAEGTVEGAADDGDATLTVSQGWYAVTDAADADGDGKSELGVTAIVATTVDGLTGTFLLDKDAGQDNIDLLGEFNAKNANAPNPPSKTVTKGEASVNDKSVNVGDTLSYTITHKIPAAAAGYGDYKYVITDTASKGLAIGAMTVKAGDVVLAADVDYEVATTGDAASGTTTTITFASAAAKLHAGKTVTVAYDATVTSDIYGNNGEATNSATATIQGEETGAGTTTVKTHGFDFIKKNKAGAGLQGAEFNVYRGTDVAAATPLKFKDGVLSDAADASPVLTSGQDGRVQVKGLAAGEYTIVETKAPAGYSGQFLARFTVAINEKGAATLEAGGNRLSLAFDNSAKDEPAIAVLNVTSAAQLPLTGAAGTVLFTVIAVLIAGAAMTVGLKARSTRRMLNV